MNKTQQALIDKAAQHGHFTIECGGGRGAKGGRISYGARERDALFALEEAGHVRITCRDSSDIWMGNGNQIRVTTMSFEVAA